MENLCGGELGLTLAMLVNNPSFSDISFVCKDNVVVYATKWLLASRSSFLTALLLGKGMIEENATEFPLPKISSTALVYVFRFCYTGSMFLGLERPQWSTTYDILDAAAYLLLDGLVQCIFEYQREQLNEMFTLPGETQINTAAKYLTTCVQFEHLWEGKDTYVLDTLIRVLRRRPLELDEIQEFSREALSLFVVDAVGDSQSFSEYVKLRHILLWLAVQSDQQLPDLFDKYCPVAYEALRLLEENKIKDHLAPTDGALKEVIASVLEGQSLLGLVELKRIHPGLITKIVEPLGLFESKRVLDAYTHHVWSEPSSQELPMVWDSSQRFRSPHGDKSMLERIDRLQVRDEHAIVILPACTRSYAIYEWDVILKCKLARGESFPIIGVVNEENLSTWKLSGEQGWTFTKSRGGQCKVNRRFDVPASSDTQSWTTARWKEYDRVEAWRVYGMPAKNITVVRVYFNREEKYISFSYPGQTFENGAPSVAFKNVPQAFTIHQLAFVECTKSKSNW